MARNVKIINVDRQPVKIGTTLVPPATTAGTALTTVNLNTPKVRKDLRTHYDRVIVVEGLQAAANANVAKNMAIAGAVATASPRTTTFTLTTAEGAALTARNMVDVWFGTSATDPTLAAAGPTTAPAIVSSTGAIVGTLTAGKAYRCITDATGVLKLSVTNSSPTTFYVWASLADGTTTVQTIAVT